jgi:hemerythrin-like domain-containing protein
MEMKARPNFYRDVHKGIRILMFDLIEKSGRTDYGNPEELSSLRSAAHSCFELLGHHAEHENQALGAIVERHAPELLHLVGAAHDDQEKQIEDLMQMLERVDPADSDAAVAGHSFSVELSHFFGELLMHMADEEQQIMPALWRTHSDEELEGIHQRLVGTMPPERLASFLRWMLPAMNTPERVEMLTGLRFGAPPSVFAFVRELAAAVLTSADDAALEAGLSATAAA